MLSICLLKSQEIAPDSGAPIWHLMVSEAPPTANGGDRRLQTESAVDRDNEPEARGDGKLKAWRDKKTQRSGSMPDDPIPF